MHVTVTGDEFRR